MKVSDYIVEYLIEHGITDVFGYPGGMVTHLMESFSKYKDNITAHVVYHEQGASFAACGYAQTSGKLGVAYATSGPGATNLITGICNAYYDSIPALFITGQVNTFESKGNMDLRQRGFQETNIVDMVRGVTKYVAYVDNVDEIKYHLDKAFFEACDRRKGPVLLDIPMNIFRGEIDKDTLVGYKHDNEIIMDADELKSIFEREISRAKRPCLLIGNGVKTTKQQKLAKEVASFLKMPVVTSMVAFDVLQDSAYTYGFVGAYGDRVANFIVAKSDLIITVGSRLDIRQVGFKRENFAPDARILRFDIDKGEMSNVIRDDEVHVVSTVTDALKAMSLSNVSDYTEWIAVCNEIRNSLKSFDDRLPNEIVSKISNYVDSNNIITTDVGQNQVWVAQSFKLKKNQEVLFSGGMGAMGYSLPAAIGAYYGTGKHIVCFNGDGGLQMNIQELQWIVREQLPIKIIVLNNNALGMIRHFQEMYFDSNYFQTKPEGGYSAPNFCQIASAYGIANKKVESISEIVDMPEMHDEKPFLLEVIIDENTYVFPKLEFGKPNQDQEPLLDRNEYNRLMDL